MPLEERRRTARSRLPVRKVAVMTGALCLGLLVVALVRMMPASPARTMAAAPARPAAPVVVPVVVAAAPIARGAVLEGKLLKIVQFPAGSAPAGVFPDIGQLTGTGPNARVALRAMVAGEPILSDRVTEPGGRANLSGTLMPGLRAIGVKANDVTGVGGFLLPGDRVDVMATQLKQDGVSTIRILAQNVRVLGVDQSDDQDADKPHVAEAVTIEVTPDAAQAISLAQAIGAVTLSLRQFGDAAPVTRSSLSSVDLGASAPAAATKAGSAPARPRAPAAATVDANTAQVRVTRGVETAQYTVGR